MKTLAIIPVYNEEEHIRVCLDSIISQIIPPDQLIVVDDGSTDSTPEILAEFAEQHDWIYIVQRPQKHKHETGGGVVKAVQFGLDQVNTEDFDIILKLDADLIFPESYLEIVIEQFTLIDTLGICGGVCVVNDGKHWQRESRGKNDHVRGALKAWRRTCFEEIGGLRSGMGWDTVDEHLARYQGWYVLVLENLFVKHLKPTDIKTNSKKANALTGQAYYKMGYGPVISAISALKHAGWNPSSLAFWRIYKAYVMEAIRFEEKFVTPKQARFIRRYRYKSMIGDRF